MLRTYSCVAGSLQETATAPVWFDLLNATPEETRAVETAVGVSIPTRAAMEEIELSARLYQEDGAEFMTMTVLTKLDDDAPIKTPITFILKGQVLVTARFAEPKPFEAYCLRAQKSKAGLSASGEAVMLGLLEAVSDRTADALEKITNDVDKISREVFTNKADNARKKTRDLHNVILQIGRRSELLTAIQESLVSLGRLVAYHIAADTNTVNGQRKAAHQQIELVQRDAVSLGEYAESLDARLSFLLEATLGLINLEQNGIIKIFSVAAVVFLPPTLVASIYGMNFAYMPELDRVFGYPFALGLMVLSAILPYLFFKRRGWL